MQTSPCFSPAYVISAIEPDKHKVLQLIRRTSSAPEFFKVARAYCRTILTPTMIIGMVK